MNGGAVRPSSYRERCFIQKHGVFLLRNVKSRMTSAGVTGVTQLSTAPSPASEEINKTSQYQYDSISNISIFSITVIIVEM